ncbi:hypothetical protein Cni_G24625 [Canna indica]|uniref:Protein kinase domain-containing protein n=1 Tax=Canna indica TaxID=4628 RepID=A0AAQ3KW63_9LILI|nr:hypothetical protein Cni_G24625 [Canna indica]
MVFKMNWFSCFGRSNKEEIRKVEEKSIAEDGAKEATVGRGGEEEEAAWAEHITTQVFSFRELSAATKGFKQECLLGEDLPHSKEPLDWSTRMKIAAGAAEGLEYLHDKASPPVIFRDFKSSNILLGKGYHPKLSDFGLAKLGPLGDKSHVSTRARPMFKDRRCFLRIADPLLRGCFPKRGLFQAIAIAAMCLQEQAAARPKMTDVVTALSYLAYNPNSATASNRVVISASLSLKTMEAAYKNPTVGSHNGHATRSTTVHKAKKSVKESRKCET